MSMLSGWCLAAPGAVAPHRWCRFEGCSCSCHAENPAQPKGSDRFAAVDWPEERGPDRANESDPLATVSTTAKGA